MKSFRLENFDTILFDCDGVLWRGKELIRGGTSVIQQLRHAGKHVIFVTNNSSSSRLQYQAKLKDKLNLDVNIDDIYCSSFAAAAYLKQQQFRGKAYVIGHEGIGEVLLLRLPWFGYKL